MPAPGWVERFRPYSVPLSLFAVVALVVLLVPPLVLGEATGRTYALTAAVLIIAISSVIPYAVLVAVLTLPLPYLGVGSYAAPAVIPTGEETLSAMGAVRHVVAGVFYVVAAAAVGAIGIGVDFAASSGSSGLPSAFAPPFMLLGGAVVAGVFVSVQFWRYGGSHRPLRRRSILGTVGLGSLLAVSPAVALWVFNTAGG